MSIMQNEKLRALIMEELDDDIKGVVDMDDADEVTVALLLQSARYQRYTANHTDRIEC